jgi:glycerol-3-phosphate acyltransferase PlsY
MVGLIVLPLLGLYLYMFTPTDAWLIFLEAVLAYIFLINLYNTVRLKRLRLRSTLRETIRWWRFLLRPAALIFAALYQTAGARFTLTLMGATALVFLTLDVLRLGHGRINRFLFKKFPLLLKPKEERRISSITQFLLSIFLVFLLFRYEIALLALLFLIFGDMAAKFFGLQFGKHAVYGKTLEGSLAFLLFCLIVGSIYFPYAALPWPAVIFGALAATLAEGMPWGLDDNLTVTVLSASAMHLALQF